MGYTKWLSAVLNILPDHIKKDNLSLAGSANTNNDKQHSFKHKSFVSELLRPIRYIEAVE